MSRKLIRNATIVSVDPKIGTLSSGDILIDGGKIADVRPDIGAVDAETVDGTDMIVIPGFCDSHRHTWESLLRNAGADWTLGQYFGGVRLTVGHLYTPDDMYIANYLGALEALDAGFTTLYDWSHNNNSRDHADAAVKGLKDSGIRSVFGYGNSCKEWIPVSDIPTNFKDVEWILKTHYASSDGLHTMAFAARGPQYSTLEVAIADFRTAHDLGLPVTVHVGDGLGGMSKPLFQLREHGCIYPGTTYVHCNTLSEDEFAIIADSGGTISMSPELELNMGHGELATWRALDAGIRPSISVDVVASIGGDMFSQMKVLMADTRGTANLRALKQRRILDPLPIMVADILEFATLQGARAAGLSNKVGSITPGKEADLVMLNTNAFNMFPVNNPVGAVVEAAHVGNIDTVMVRGKFVKRHGKLLDVDLQSVRRRADAARDGLFKRAGVPTDGTWLPRSHNDGIDYKMQ